MQDNLTSEIRGKIQQIANEKKLILKINRMQSKCVLPYFIKGNNVVIRWQFRFEFLNYTFVDIEEIAYQVWSNEQIVKEQFFFDPIQLTPKPIKQP